MLKLKGIPASSGIAIGKNFSLDGFDIFVQKRKISYEEISREIYKFEEALISTRKEIASFHKQVSQELGFSEAKIFEAHMLVLEDRTLIEDVIEQIKRERVNVEYAFLHAIKKYIKVLKELKDDYLKERAVDIEDIGKRVLKKLAKDEADKPAKIKEEVVVVAHDLSPSDMASLPKNKVLGIVTDIGGRTSHVAIIARTLNIPAVVGVETVTKHLRDQTTVIVDGSEGLVVINPTERLLEKYHKKQDRIFKERQKRKLARKIKAKTLDNREVLISANIELPDEIPLVKRFGADGVGLYRTEYLFLGKDSLPSEEEQYQAYAQVAKDMKSAKVTIRTIDVGGDKFLSQLQMPREFSPFLGWRAIRFCLAKPEIFKKQIRAILRASAVAKNIKIMFPMISGIEELRQAKAIVQECQKELRKEGKPFDENIPVGVMIEIPSAALTADLLAAESDFFSIGTNDLIQYSIAVDRANEKVAYLYRPMHPAVLRLINGVVDAAHNNDIWVEMCGEMAGEAHFTLVLLGIGLDELSMPPPRIFNIKTIISKINFSYAQEVAQNVLQMTDHQEIDKYLKEALKKALKKQDYLNLITE